MINTTKNRLHLFAFSAKRRHFIKFDQRIHQYTGCTRATLIFSALEYWFSKKPDGFYKFIEPCSHKLYKPGDSWTEELGCDRKSFTKSFEKIGTRYASRSAYEKVPDKFQGKPYASYYDRYTNRTFFIRNPELVNDFLSTLYPPQSLPSQPQLPALGTETVPDPGILASPSSVSVIVEPVSNGRDSPSSIEAKNTSIDLSNDKSHAGIDTQKSMVDLWVQIVESGKKEIILTAQRISFLKKALADKFHNSLEEWANFCKRVASSKFLMGEVKASFKATLDWALKFDVMQRIFEGAYGIGDRKLPPSPLVQELLKFQQETDNQKASIQASGECQAIQDFRLGYLRLWGAHHYQEFFKGCLLEMEDAHTLFLRPATRYQAKWIAGYDLSGLLSEKGISKIHLFQKEGDLTFERWIVKSPPIDSSSCIDSSFSSSSLFSILQAPRTNWTALSQGGVQ